MPSASQVPRGYRAMTITVREQDAAEAKRISQALKSEGWTHASMSFVARAAFVFLSDKLRGKTPDEILHFFVETRARREQQRVSATGAVSPVKV